MNKSLWGRGLRIALSLSMGGMLAACAGAIPMHRMALSSGVAVNHFAANHVAAHHFDAYLQYHGHTQGASHSGGEDAAGMPHCSYRFKEKI